MPAPSPQPVIRFGLLADAHYADLDPDRGRCFRASLDKLARAADRFHRADVDFIVQLGDLIESRLDPEMDLEDLRAALAALDPPSAGFECHHVLGNHDLLALTKTRFIEAAAARPAPYGFDRRGFRFIVLDGCYRADGDPYIPGHFEWRDAALPDHELRWLQRHLADAPDHPPLSSAGAGFAEELAPGQNFRGHAPDPADPAEGGTSGGGGGASGGGASGGGGGGAVIFTHHRLDLGPDHDYALRNAAAVRRVLESSGRSLAVFQAHHHQPDHRHIHGIHYITLAPIIAGPDPDDSGFAIAALHTGGPGPPQLRLDGYHRQPSLGLTMSQR